MPYDELYMAGAREIVGALPQYTGAAQIVGTIPQYTQDHMRQAYAAGAAAAAQQLQNAAPRGNAIAYGSNLGTNERPPRDARLFPLPFTLLAIPASATATVTSRPQVLFRPQRLVVASSAVQTNFVINDIRVGKDSQFVQAGSLEAAVFAPNAVGVMLTFDTCQQGCDVSLVVQNTDAAAAHDFRATFFGAAVQ
jgi:hypothetical protein